MVELGYALSSEELPAPELVANARRAEESGFGFALVSDHFHPWLDAQGESPFVWSTVGAISQATDSLILGTGVRQVFPAPAVRRAFVEAGLALEPMDTGAACRTYNVLLAEGRSVGAALMAVG